MSEIGSRHAIEVAAETARDLLTGPVLYVPIRHHSPACAEHVQSVIREHTPAHVLVEGPPSFDDQIDLLLDPEAEMPLAIYSHATFATESEDVEPKRQGSYFPLCDYSPELVALRTGREVGAQLGFIDLDYTAMATIERFEGGHTDERQMLFSDVLSRSASELGCRDHNELWDQMVEGADATTEDHVAAVLTYGNLARFGAAEADLVAAGTHARELAMAQRIAELIRTDPGQTLVVVTGAFHTVALPALVDRILEGDAIEVPEAQQPIDAGHGLIRYGFERLDALAGYAAGMASPRWYQMEWERRTGDSNEPPADRVIGEVARRLREAARDGQPSLPTIVDATAAVRQLHHLRGRAVPTRLDVIDAMVSCFIKTEDTPRHAVRLESHRAMTGFALGTMPPNAPRAPLALDFDRVAKSLGLATDTTEAKQVNLDVYRSERDREKSRFLHGLDALNVRYGTCISPLRFSRSRGRDLIRERWTVHIDGATDVSLTEAALWGSSVTEAVAARTVRSLTELLASQPSSASLMSFVRTAAERGVHSVLAQTLEALRSRIGVDPSLEDVVSALTEAELLWVGREPLGGASLEVMPELAAQLYVRACQLGGRMHEAPAEQRRALVEALASTHRMLLTATWEGLDHELFWHMLAAQRAKVEPGILRGAIAGLEWRGGVIDDTDLRDALDGHIGLGASAAAGASFLEGLILVARDALWEVQGIVASLSSMIERPDGHSFLRRIPALRAAFSALTPAETDRIASLVMTHLGQEISVRVVAVPEQEVLRNAAMSMELEARLAADGLGSWVNVQEAST